MDAIVHVLQGVRNGISQALYMFRSFFTSVGDLIGNVISVISTMFYGLKTITLAVIDLIKQIFELSTFSYLTTGFNLLSQYIGGVPAIFIATLLFVVFVRIGIAFIFKIFRLNLDYKNKGDS